MSDLQLLSTEEKAKIDEITSMPRKARRSLGKSLGVKIPGSQQPISKEHATWRP